MTAPKPDPNRRRFMQCTRCEVSWIAPVSEPCWYCGKTDTTQLTLDMIDWLFKPLVEVLS